MREVGGLPLHHILYQIQDTWHRLGGRGTVDTGLSLKSTPGTQQYAGGKEYSDWRDVSGDHGPWSTCYV